MYPLVIKALWITDNSSAPETKQRNIKPYKRNNRRRNCCGCRQTLMCIKEIKVGESSVLPGHCGRQLNDHVQGGPKACGFMLQSHTPSPAPSFQSKTLSLLAGSNSLLSKRFPHFYVCLKTPHSLYLNSFPLHIGHNKQPLS